MGAKSVLTLGLPTDGALDGNHSELQLESIGRIGEGDIELVVERPGVNANVGLVVARSDLVRLMPRIEPRSPIDESVGRLPAGLFCYTTNN